MKKMISLSLVLVLILSLCANFASAEVHIYHLDDEKAEEKIAARISPDVRVNVQLFPDYPGPDFAENNEGIFNQVQALIPSAQKASGQNMNNSSFNVVIPAGEFTKLKGVAGLYDALIFITDEIPVNEDGTVDILIVYGNSMTAVQQKQYNNAGWTEKIGMLEKLYAQSKIDLFDSIGAVCEYQVLRDTSINRIYLRVPQSAVDEIKKISIVKSVRIYTFPETKLNSEAQKLIAEADPRQVVSVIVSTDRGEVVAMRDYLNVTKQQMNAYFAIEDENNINEWVWASVAYYRDYHNRLLDKIQRKTDAIWQTISYISRGGETITDLDTNCWSRFLIPVGQLEALSEIDGIAAITYEPPKEQDPYQNWFVLSGDMDLARKVCGEPNEYGMFYVAPGVSFDMNEEEYRHFKEIEYVKGVTYCRPAPTDGWWKLEGNPSLLRATYGEPNEDGRYYVPKKEAVKGDVDYDYLLTVMDATGIQRELAELSAEHFNIDVADYDDDGDVTVLDATAIQRTLVE